jgi:hypothetical protein
MKAFNTPYYVFASSGIVQTARYKIEEGRTFFAPDTHLFKHHLKLLNPKAGAKLGASDKANLPVHGISQELFSFSTSCQKHSFEQRGLTPEFTRRERKASDLCRNRLT